MKQIKFNATQIITGLNLFLTKAKKNEDNPNIIPNVDIKIKIRSIFVIL
jgi:hypothetical protein